MINFRIKDYVDSYNDHAKAGNAVYKDAVPLINQGDVILFDMKDLDGVSTVFLNTSFGQLIDLYGSDRVKKSFRFTNLLKSQAERIKKYFIDYADVNNNQRVV